MIAHRLSTITNADRIIVLKNGCIEAGGTQDELLSESALYRQMWEAHIGAKSWSAGNAKIDDRYAAHMGKEGVCHV